MHSSVQLSIWMYIELSGTRHYATTLPSSLYQTELSIGNSNSGLTWQTNSFTRSLTANARVIMTRQQQTIQPPYRQIINTKKTITIQ